MIQVCLIHTFKRLRLNVKFVGFFKSQNPDSYCLMLDVLAASLKIGQLVIFRGTT
jgi:hypothetical protein